MGNIVVNNIQKVVQQLISGELEVWDLPKELELQKEIVATERRLGLRIEGRRGYDVIRDHFFVEETISRRTVLGMLMPKDSKIEFDDLASYYDFLDGDIYTDACYAYCDWRRHQDYIAECGIDVHRLEERNCFARTTIDDMQFEASAVDLEHYKAQEAVRRALVQWINKLDKCTTAEELHAVVTRYLKSKVGGVIDYKDLIIDYACRCPDDQRFDIAMEYIAQMHDSSDYITNALCLTYGGERVLENFHLYASKAWRVKRKRRLRDTIKMLESHEIELRERAYYNDSVHLYCVETRGFTPNGYMLDYMGVIKLFRSFEEFAQYRNNDLRHTDLSRALLLDVDLSTYITDNTTRPPLSSAKSSRCVIQKGYREQEFYVEKKWLSENDMVLKNEIFKTPYLFDYVAFLKGDLSNADLLYCDGLIHLSSIENINLSGARLQSCICRKFGISYDQYRINTDAITSFPTSEYNETLSLPGEPRSEEEESALAESWRRDEFHLLLECHFKQRPIRYISDLHLLHRLQNAGCDSDDDVIYEIHKIACTLVTEMEFSHVLLIGGDVASDYTIYEMFVRELARLRDQRAIRPEIIFVLGNHELWPFEDMSIADIAAKYRSLLHANGMYLLYNDLIFQDNHGVMQQFPSDVLMGLETDTIRQQLQRARMVLFGGIGYSGYNKEFNATQGIYRNTLSRDAEIEETQQFERLYHRLVPVIRDKNTVILTHMPIEDWSSNPQLEKGIVYVSGHTHHNNYYDDGDYRSYADNQVGYNRSSVHLKGFLLSDIYDIFADYADGIYEIDRSQYLDFYQGKHISISFRRDDGAIHMLKRDGYYLFIWRSAAGRLSIMNGGALKGLDCKDIQYYYYHMNDVISLIMNPLDTYTALQKRVSDAVKAIGGDGNIHGCIIDIDGCNHVYVNPYDGKLTAYFAWDMVNKLVYASVPALLQQQCPLFYDRLMKQMEAGEGNVLVPTKYRETRMEIMEPPIAYPDTDIYRESREIRKMQRLSSNILCGWYEPAEQGGQHMPRLMNETE